MAELATVGAAGSLSLYIQAVLGNLSDAISRATARRGPAVVLRSDVAGRLEPADRAGVRQPGTPFFRKERHQARPVRDIVSRSRHDIKVIRLNF